MPDTMVCERCGREVERAHDHVCVPLEPGNEPARPNDILDATMAASPALTFVVDDGRGDLGKCSSCGRPVVWLVMKRTGKRNPCDPTLYTVSRGDQVIAKGRVSHFATCPNAAKHRKKRTKRK